MSEPKIDSLKDLLFYIPRKIIVHFETYKMMEQQIKKDAKIKEAYRRRLGCIKVVAEENHYGNETVYKRKIIELATRPIEDKF